MPVKSPSFPLAAVHDWWAADWWWKRQPTAWPHPAAVAVHRLDPTERATIRIRPPVYADVPLDRGHLSEAMLRLGIFGQRGYLASMSAHTVAQNLQSLYGYAHPGAMRYAKRGWEFLATVALAEFIDITIDATPTDDDPLHFRPMSLADRLRELGADVT